MASISITWHTMQDDRVCPICKELEGYTWTFIVGHDQFNGLLVHPVHGTVWNLTSGSEAHGHRGRCRCNITHIVDVSDLVEKSRKILELLKMRLTLEGKR